MAPEKSILFSNELRLAYNSDKLCLVRVIVIGEVEANMIVLLYWMF